MSEPAPIHQIVVRDLHKSLGPQRVLRGVDLRVREGETMVIIGRSGAGKSVLLRHIIGLSRPDRGQILICGRDIAGLDERRLGEVRARVGMLFQSGALFDWLTVEENIAFPLREAGERDEGAIRERVTQALEVVDLLGHGHKMPVALSGGMKKRVGLARAIITRPSCILYDEPTSGLDPVASDSINRLIRRLQARFGVTSIVVTHDMTSAFAIADQIAFLNLGRIHFAGTPGELRATGDPTVRDFVEGRSAETVEVEQPSPLP